MGISNTSEAFTRPPVVAWHASGTNVGEANRSGIHGGVRQSIAARLWATLLVIAAIWVSVAATTVVARADDYTADPTTTGVVVVGGSTSGNIEAASDSDWIKVNLVAGTSYRITISGRASGGGSLKQPYLILYNSAGQALLWDVDGSSSGDPSLYYTPGVTGAYFVGVYPGLNFVSGTGTYIVSVATTDAFQTIRVGSVFSGAQVSSQSFLRFFNAGWYVAPVSVALADSVTGQTLGRWTSPSIPIGEEVQYSISAIEAAAGVVAKPDFYSVVLQTNMTGFFQHVLWRSADGTLTNLSTCGTGVNSNTYRLTAVHSTLLGSDYPSTVVVNNTDLKAAPARLNVYDARNGQSLGTYTTSSIPPHGQATVTVAAIEAALRLSPTAGMYHYNIKADQVSFSGFLQHLVTNVKAGVVTDMTTNCALFPDALVAPATSPPLAGAVYSTVQANSQSFLRFFNAGTKADTVTVNLYNYATGESLGQWTSSPIAAGSEQQFDIRTIENGTGAGFARPDFYSLKVQSNFSGYFQHVLWRSADGTLTNLSTCAAGVAAGSTELAGVHSTLLAAYPSTVVVNNSGAGPEAVALGIYDARDGSKLGTYTTPVIPAGAQAILLVGAIEARLGKAPTSGMFHYVVKTEGTFTGFLQHLVDNTRAGVITDMTTVCTMPVTPVRVASAIVKASSPAQSLQYAGVAYSEKHVVKVMDSGGKPVSDQKVRWSADNGGWTIAADELTDADGFASATWVPGLAATSSLVASIEGSAGSVAFTSSLKNWAANPTSATYFWQDFPSATGISREVTPLTDPAGTYFSVIQWDGGYTGLQRGGSYYQSQLQFSAWDKNGKQTTVVDAGNAICVRFGNEGTGTACALSYPWTTGKTYRLEVTRQISGASTDLTGYVIDVATGVRTFVATLRQDGVSDMINAAAFIEAFSFPSNNCMQIPERTAIFGNTMYLASGQWNSVRNGVYTPSDPTSACALQGYALHSNAIEMGVGGKWKANTLSTWNPVSY